MPKITVYTYGKVKTPGLLDACEYFEKIASKFCEFTVFEAKPAVLPNKTKESKSLAQKQEHDQYLAWASKLKTAPVLYVLDETGQTLSTQSWCEEFRAQWNQGHSHFVFLVGGAMGVDPVLRKSSRKCLSFGPQTLSHDLARTVLMEQIFRVLALHNGHPYHHEG